MNALEPAGRCVQSMPCYINARNGSVFDDLDGLFEGKKFDVIILSHVAEHLYDIKGAIRNVLEVLKFGGRIYIEVPDASRYTEYYKVPFHFFDVEHINHFDARSLSHLGLSVGLAGIDVVEKTIGVSGTELYPAVGVVFVLRDAEKSVMQYVEKSLSDRRFEGIADLIASQAEVAVWGAGSYTKRLLSSSLRDVRISFFVDSDSGKQGGALLGRKVLGPNALRDFDGPIIVASAVFSAEILEQIRGMKLDNRVFVL